MMSIQESSDFRNEMPQSNLEMNHYRLTFNDPEDEGIYEFVSWRLNKRQIIVSCVLLLSVMTVLAFDTDAKNYEDPVILTLFFLGRVIPTAILLAWNCSSAARFVRFWSAGAAVALFMAVSCTQATSFHCSRTPGLSGSDCSALQQGHVPWLSATMLSLMPYILCFGLRVRWDMAFYSTGATFIVFVSIVLPQATQAESLAVVIVTLLQLMIAIAACWTYELHLRDAFRREVSMRRKLDSIVASSLVKMVAQEQGQRLFELIKRSRYMMAEYNTDGTFAFVSPASVELFGRQPDALTNTDFLHHVHRDDRERVREAINKLRDGPDEHLRVDFRRLHLDGRYVWVELNAHVVMRPFLPNTILGIERPIAADKPSSLRAREAGGPQVITGAGGGGAVDPHFDRAAYLGVYEMRTPVDASIAAVKALRLALPKRPDASSAGGGGSGSGGDAAGKRAGNGATPAAMNGLGALDPEAARQLHAAVDAVEAAAGMAQGLITYALSTAVSHSPLPVVEPSTQSVMAVLRGVKAMGDAMSPCPITLNVDSSVPAELATDSVRLTQVLMNAISNSARAVRGRADAAINLSVTACQLPSYADGIKYEVMDNGVGVGSDVERFLDVVTPTVGGDASAAAGGGIDPRGGGRGGAGGARGARAVASTDLATARDVRQQRLGLSVCRELVIAMGGARPTLRRHESSGLTVFAFEVPVHMQAHGLALAPPTPVAPAGGAEAGVAAAAAIEADAADSSAGGKAGAGIAAGAAAAAAAASAAAAAPGGVAADERRRSGSRAAAEGSSVSASTAPAAAAAASAPQSGGRSEGSKSQALATTGMHVLLVDDERVNRRLGARMLTRLGCEYVLLEDGDQVAEALRTQGPFDAILMDIVMRRSDGAVVCKALRKAGCALPIIAMTGNTGVRDVQRFMQHGFDLVLPKPFDIKAMGRALHEGRARRLRAEAAARETAGAGGTGGGSDGSGGSPPSGGRSGSHPAAAASSAGAGAGAGASASSGSGAGAGADASAGAGAGAGARSGGGASAAAEADGKTAKSGAGTAVTSTSTAAPAASTSGAIGTSAADIADPADASMSGALEGKADEATANSADGAAPPGSGKAAAVAEAAAPKASTGEGDSPGAGESKAAEGGGAADGPAA